MPPANLRRKALQMLLLCTAFWALSFPVMKALTLAQQNLLPGAGTWFISSLCVMLRFLIAGLLMLLVSPASVKTLTRRELEQGLWLALFVSAGNCLQMDGLAYVPASTSAFLTQLYCVLIPLWVAATRQRFPGMKILTCSALVLGGMAILANLNVFALRLGRGELETLAASVMYTAQILCLDNPRYAANRPRSLTTIMLLAMGLFTLPLVAVTAPGLAQCIHVYSTIPTCGLLGLLVLVCSIVPFLLMNRWQREVTATEAGLVYCAEPVVTSLLALFLPGWFSLWAGVNYPNEQVTTRLLIGGGFITVANILLQLRWLEPPRIECPQGTVAKAS
jgi:drug/metabolite transporter (DMT)-like permease